MSGARPGRATTQMPSHSLGRNLSGVKRAGASFP